jgi:ATP-binding cassette subfamily F protein 3
MLTVHQISKSYGIEAVLRKVSFTLNRGERLGLVGPNGCGKTTLLRILAGVDAPDSGSVRFYPPGLRVGYLPQGVLSGPDETLESYLVVSDANLSGLSEEITRLAEALVQSPAEPALQRDYDLALSQLEAASESASRLPQVLGALGLGEFALDSLLANLSGGQKTRLSLARVLLNNPQLLLLDEPTNHLDLDMLEWLESWLGGFPGAVLVVSHDRAFLDGAATSILEIDPQTHTALQFAGNYAAYLEQKMAEREKQWQEYKEQQHEITQLRAAVAHVRKIGSFKRGGKGDSGDKFAKGFFANRSKETIRRAKHLEARLEKLMTEDKVDKPRQSWQMKLEFEETPTSGRDVLVLEDLSVGYGALVLLAGLNQTLKYGARTALIGPNGAGKTTLLRTIAGKLEPISGQLRLGASVKIGYMAQEQEDLLPELNAFEMICRTAAFSETDARTFLHRFLFTGDDVFVPVGLLSYGERARLSLACLVAQGCNFLLLDEPVNHLDIPSRTRFEQALGSFDGTILAVVHDRYFIEGFASELWEVQGQGLPQVLLHHFL